MDGKRDKHAAQLGRKILSSIDRDIKRKSRGPKTPNRRTNYREEDFVAPAIFFAVFVVVAIIWLAFSQ